MSAKPVVACEKSEIERVFAALQARDHDAVTTALEGGFDINQRDENGRTLLMVAAISDANSRNISNCRMVVLLIIGGAALDVQDNNGDTAMHHAVRANGWMRVLCDAGANRVLRNNKQELPHEVGTRDIALLAHNLARSELRHDVCCAAATATTNFDRVRLSLERAWALPVVQRDVEFHKVLETACYFGHLPLMTLLFENGAHDLAGALSVACSEGHEAAARLLLSWAPEVETATLLSRHDLINLPFRRENRQEYSPLARASYYGHLRIMELLMDAGGDPGCDADLPPYHMPLWMAVDNGQLEAIRLLLSRGANVNATFPHGHATVLCRAVEVGHVDVVRLLLDVGADMRISADGKIALYWAAEKGKLAMIDTLLAHENALKASGDVARLQGEGEKKKNNPLFDLRDRDHLSAAMVLAAGNGHIDAVEVLLKAGADINACATLEHIIPKGAEFETAMGLACQRKPANCLQMVEYLVEHGGDVNARCNMSAATPLLWAATHGLEDTVAYLIRQGADVNAYRSSGSTVVSKAAGSGNVACVQTVLAAGGSVFCPPVLRDKPPALHQHLPPREIGDALLVAARANVDLEIFRLLLDHGARVNEAYRTASLFMEAVRCCDSPVISLLLIHGAAGINTPSTYVFDPEEEDLLPRMTPLVLACTWTDEDAFAMRFDEAMRVRFVLLPALCQVLLDCGADPRIPDHEGHTALWHAAIRGDVVAARLLLDYGDRLSELPDNLPVDISTQLHQYNPVPRSPRAVPIQIGTTTHWVLPWDRSLHAATPRAFRQATRALCLLRSRVECEPTWGCLPNEVFEVAVAILWREEMLVRQADSMS